MDLQSLHDEEVTHHPGLRANGLRGSAPLGITSVCFTCGHLVQGPSAVNTGLSTLSFSFPSPPNILLWGRSTNASAITSKPPVNFSELGQLVCQHLGRVKLLPTDDIRHAFLRVKGDCCIQFNKVWLHHIGIKECMLLYTFVEWADTKKMSCIHCTHFGSGSGGVCGQRFLPLTAGKSSGR